MISRSARLWSLWDMLEINGVAFYEATTELARIKTIIDASLNDEDRNAVVAPEVRARFLNDLDNLMTTLLVIGARVTWMAADDLRRALFDPESTTTYGQMGLAIQDIGGRFRHELMLVKLYVISGDKTGLLNGADYLLGQPTADRFKDVWFECEEAAKCLAVGRPTACVFHTMRMLEVGIRALSKRLGIENPTKSTQRNWGAILSTIKTAIDSKFPQSSRLAHTEGALLESIYASLDAIKNPWRNATMHVEEIYTDSEALHILQCSATLIQKMAGGFDQDGNDVEGATFLKEQVEPLSSAAV